MEQAPETKTPDDRPSKPPTSPDPTPQSRWERSWPTIACGAGLFSDGYLQSVIGPVNTILATLYPTTYASGAAASNVSSIAFVGTVVGQLAFGYTSDRFSRKWSLLVSTVILVVFSVLGATAYGSGDSDASLFAALTAYRSLLGIGIGGEYPAGSVGCAESAGQLKKGHRNRWFIMFTNVQVDLGFVLGALVPTVAARIAPHHLHMVWRVCLGLGAVAPLSLLYLRARLQDPASFRAHGFRRGRIPYRLALRFYGRRLVLVAAIWFLYDLLSYPFSIYASQWIAALQPRAAPLWNTFAWSTVINSFYLPGAVAGSFLSDLLGPHRALAAFVALQGVVGFVLAACYPALLRAPALLPAFVVLYGLFLLLGEIGPGDNLGLVAARSSATGVRAHYYAVAAAAGKLGAFVGAYVFPLIARVAGGPASLHGGQYPFFVASALCFLSAAMVLCLPRIDQDSIETEDQRFREFLVSSGWDVSAMGEGAEE